MQNIGESSESPKKKTEPNDTESEDVNYPRYGIYTLGGDMIKSVESMGDGRYIIYYSWEEDSP